MTYIDISGLGNIEAGLKALAKAIQYAAAPRTFIDLVFDKKPGPEGAVFIEAEDEHGASIDAGEWLVRPDGSTVLRIQLGGSS